MHLVTADHGDLAYDAPGRRWLLSEIAPHVALRLKNMFPRIAKTTTQSFAFPDTDESAQDLDWFLQRYPMRMSDDDRARLAGGVSRAIDRRAEALRVMGDAWTPDLVQSGFKPGLAPYPNQDRNAALAVAMGRLLIMDDVGLGKSISALAAALRFGRFPVALVVQAHLATQWLEKFIQGFTTLRGHIIKGTRPYALPPADVYVFRYTNIAGWVDVAATGLFPVVIFDEVQDLRGGTDTAKGKAAAVFSNHAALHIGLSATPILNYGAEIWNVMEFIAPGELGAYWDFVREWCGAGRVVKHPDALGTYLRDQHLTVRQERAGRPINTVLIEVEYDEDIERAELDLVRTLAIRVVSGSFVERGQAARELDIKLREITGIAKARHVAAYVRVLLEAGEPVLLAGWHREVYAIWAEALADFKPAFYTGSESTTQKDESKRRFVEGETDLMIISLRSGAGLDGLQHRCATAVVGELDWSPKVHDQLLGRLDRPGQTREVTALFLHADGGSDPLVVSMNGLKASQSEGLLNPLGGPQEVRSDESRIRMLAEQFLARQGETVQRQAAE